MRESRTLEYKENLSSNTFLKTISAYANYGEGKIIFGINDQGNIIGITDPVNGCLNLENKINDSLSPVPEFRLEIQENTIVLTVYEGRYKPYLYKGKAYKRNDIGNNKKFNAFCHKNRWWLDDYALYMAIKNENDLVSWQER